jgi:molybdenum cofactor biosynthesis enzyme MoaA
MNRLPANACAYPFKAEMLMHGQPSTPCCRFHTRFLPEDKSFNEIRETMMRNEWHPGCYKCKSDEEVKGSSMRTEADEFFDDFTDTVRLEYLEITVGRLCNLACLSCGADFSHTWDKDAIALGINSPEQIEKLKEVQEYDLDNINLDDLKDVKFIKVTGGEPFLHKQFLNLVVRLADSGIAGQIDLEIFTNCTWFPAKLELDALMKFKRIQLSPSIDGVGSTNDLLRYPSKWDKVEATLDKWIEVKDATGRLKIATATTVSVINAPQLHEFIHWARVHKGIEVILQTVYEPHYLSIEHWSNGFRRALDLIVDQQYMGFNKNSGKFKASHKLLKDLCSTVTNAHDDKTQEYITELKRILAHRGQDINMAPKFASIVKYLYD